MDFEKQLENVMSHATSMINDGVGIFKGMGQKFVEEGKMTQLEWNEVVEEMDKATAYGLDPTRSVEAAGMIKKVEEKIHAILEKNAKETEETE